MALIAITRRPSPLLEAGERTHVGRAPIDMAHALLQHAAYADALRSCGATVTALDDGAAFPDGVFVEDTAVVLDELAVITRPGAESRRGETEGIEAGLRPYRAIERIAAPGTLDGGDVVVTGKRILVGRSERTNDAGIESLRRLTAGAGYEVRPVGMHGCLHLKSGCTALPDGRLIVNPEWIGVGDLSDFGLVHVPIEEPWAGDVAIANGTIIAAAAFTRTIALLEREGFAVRPVDVSEFAKAEGGVTCMSLLFQASQE